MTALPSFAVAQSLVQLFDKAALWVLTNARKDLFSYSEKSGICRTCNHYENNIRTGPDFFLNDEDKEKRKNILKNL